MPDPLIKISDHENAKDQINIKVQCPICSISDNLSIPSKLFHENKGIMTISVAPDYMCEHTFHVFVDNNLKIRGYQKIHYEAKSNQKNGNKKDKNHIYTLALKLKNKIPDVFGAVIIKKSGSILSDSIPPQMDKDLVIFMGKALFGASERVARIIFNGKFKSLNVELDVGNIIIVGMDETIIGVFTRPHPNIPLITLELENCLELINSSI